MSGQALPGGYRVQVVRRTSGTPAEIAGEWAAHCTLCKHVRWVNSYDEAHAYARDTHPGSDRHQKWIGRVLVGGTPSPFRGHHYSGGHDSISRFEDWTPTSIPQWVQRRRWDAQDDDILRQRRSREQRRLADLADTISDTWGVELQWVPGDVDRVTIRDGHLVEATTVQWFNVVLNGIKLTRIGVLPDGERWVHNRKVHNGIGALTRSVNIA